MNKKKDVKKVTLAQLRAAVDNYDLARTEGSKESFEAAADELYNLVEGVIAHGSVYTYREAVIDRFDGDVNPEDFD